MKELEKEVCRECGDRVPKGESLMAFTARLLHLCKYCYGMKFPERRKRRMPSARWFHNGCWIDLRPQMSWFRQQPYVRKQESNEVEESKELLPEEIDE